MSEGGEKGIKDMGGDMWQLSDGRVMSGDEIHEALLEQYRMQDLEPHNAIMWAVRNREDLRMLYREVSVASHWGRLLKKPETLEEAKKAIGRAHGEVLGQTFAIAVGDVENMSAVTLAAMAMELDGFKILYDECRKKKESLVGTFTHSKVFLAPEYLGNVTSKNFVQALITASVANWMPIRGYSDGKRFFVTPASKDWHVLRMLDDTPEGTDWIDAALALDPQIFENMFATLEEHCPKYY